MKIFRPFAEKIPARLSNLHSTSPLEQFGKIFFSERRCLISEISRPFASKFWPLFENVSGTVVKTAIYLSRRTICRNFFRNFPSCWVTFDIWQIFCSYFARKFPAGLSKQYFTCQNEISWKIFFKVFLSRYIPILSKNFSDVWRRKLRQGFRNCILPVWSNVSRK